MHVPLKNRILSVAQMREVDTYSIETIGIPGPVLMENAGRAVAEEARQMIEERELSGTRVVVFCGPGNNGGDGFVAARHLQQGGIHVRCINLFRQGQTRGSAALQLGIADKLGLDLVYPQTKKQMADALADCDLVIDALYGTGLVRELEGQSAQAIDLINRSRLPVLAVDIASGLHGDSGLALNQAVKATRTVTFGFFKRGFFVGDGAEYTGELVLAPISLATPKNMKNLVYLNDENTLQNFLPKRRRTAHKGTFGTLYSLCGSESYSGAAVLAASAALRGGAGLVIMGLDKKTHPLVKAQLSEAVSDVLPEPSEKKNAELVQKILAGSAKATAYVIGCGLGRPKAWRPVLSQLLPQLTRPAVLDADALNALGGQAQSLLRSCKAPLVLTPHPGEFVRLCGVSREVLRSQRLELASKYAREAGVVLLLKGSDSVIAAPDGQTWINASGNPGLATGGSGDVLAGLIGAYLAQGVEPMLAARAAAFIHGVAADRISEELGEAALIAGDLLGALVQVQQSLCSPSAA